MRTYFLKRGHPALLQKQKCGLCNEPLRLGEQVVMLDLQPADEEQRERMTQGLPYMAATAELAHLGCM